MENTSNQEITQTDNPTQNTNQDSTETQPNPGAIRRRATQNILDAARQVSEHNFSSVEDLINHIADLERQVKISQQLQTNPTTAQQETKQSRVTNTDLADKYEQLKLEIAQKEEKLRERDLDNTIRAAIQDRFDSDLLEYSSAKIRQSLVFQDDEWIVVDSKQRQRYNTNGQPMTVRDLADELAQKNPKLLRQREEMPQGSGLRSPSIFDNRESDLETVPDYTRDPAAFNRWAQSRGLGRGNGLKSMGIQVSSSSQSRKIM